MNHVYLFVIVNNVIHIVMKSGKCLLMLLMILFHRWLSHSKAVLMLPDLVVEQGSDTPHRASNGTIAERKRQCHGTRCGERP